MGQLARSHGDTDELLALDRSVAAESVSDGGAVGAPPAAADPPAAVAAAGAAAAARGDVSRVVLRSRIVLILKCKLHELI